jgi:hypothetical protein
MDMPIGAASAPGRRDGQAPDIDTRPRRPAHLAEIPGWGSDLDPARRPGVPKERRPPRLEEPPAHEPPMQEPHVTVLHSPERTGLTPVFGSTLPPRGPSGLLRRLAFGYSENDLRHWLVLLAADRVGVVEGLVGDLARGHLPRLYAETGGRAELRHIPRAAVVKAATLAAGVALFIAWRRRRAARR